MKYLISVPSEKPLGGWLTTREPVVPWYPAPAVDVFLGTETFGKCYQATVEEVADLNLMDISLRLQKQYPGLPTQLHDNYVMHVANFAQAFPTGTRVQAVISPQSAKLRVVDTQKFFTLWEKQPSGRLELMDYGPAQKG